MRGRRFPVPLANLRHCSCCTGTRAHSRRVDTFPHRHVAPACAQALEKLPLLPDFALMCAPLHAARAAVGRGGLRALGIIAVSSDRAGAGRVQSLSMTRTRSSLRWRSSSGGSCRSWAGPSTRTCCCCRWRCWLRWRRAQCGRRCVASSPLTPLRPLWRLTPLLSNAADAAARRRGACWEARWRWWERIGGC